MEFNCGQNTFVPFTSTDEMVKNGLVCIVSTKYMTISMMEEFSDKSFEELHLENYNARKSSFGNNNEDFSASKKKSTNDPVTNENDQFNDIKDLMDELVKTLCKIMLKVNQTAFNNLTPSTAIETQLSSFPSASIKITPSTNTTTIMSTEPSTNVNHIPTFSPVQSNKDLFPLRNTNSNALTTSTWPSKPFTKSVFAPKQSTFNKTSTTETASSTSNPTFQSDPLLKPSGFVFNPTTSSSYFLNKTSTTRSDPFIKQPTSSNHSCWFNSPLDNPFTKSTTTPAAFNSFPSSNFNNDAKSSANFFHSHLNKQNQNSFSTRPSSPPLSDLTLTNGIYIHKPFRKNKSKEIGEKKELNADEFVLSIINCTETLEKIAFKAHKSKLIGICEKYNTHKTNILKSTFVQLQVMKSRFKSYEKFAFISESAGFLNATTTLIRSPLVI
ncbi:GSCOCG00003734001-RA-CDS [Cotesia congregata]|nr:GSCOCG00003734001-RA-CDS [Cotesia congregata]